MATVRMVKNGKYADIFDSPEMIEGAKKDGYELAAESKKTESFSFDAEEKAAPKIQGKSKRM